MYILPGEKFLREGIVTNLLYQLSKKKDYEKHNNLYFYDYYVALNNLAIYDYGGGND